MRQSEIRKFPVEAFCTESVLHLNFKIMI